MKKEWKLKEKITTPDLPEYPPLLLKLLAMRGLTEIEQIQDFLNPDFNKLHDPFLFKDMAKAVSRIKSAIEKKEKIAIYADYDADAITALCVLTLALKKLGTEPISYIPDRFAEGYGMNKDAIKKLASDGTNLIITVDCGINALEEAMVCKELGMDLIITDHHELTAALPQALAVINPKNPHDNYPFQFLTGVGVAFKLVQALFLNHAELVSASQKKDPELNLSRTPIRDSGWTPGWEKWLLDLVAVGTVADCQNLTGENRILVSFGLKVLQKTMWPGMRSLLKAAGLNEGTKFDTFTLGFLLAPRINAAGRIKHADIAFKLLVEENENEAEKLAQELNELNRHRQMLTDQILSEARAQIELTADKKVLLAYGEDWPKGVVGLVAGRLSEEYNRPVLALSTAQGVAVGSARSTANFDLVGALGSAKDLLQKYGGHTQAAGFTLASDNIEKFHQKLLEHADTLNWAISDPVLEIDAEVTGLDITWDNVGYIEKMAPFGIGNPKPKFAGHGLQITETRLVGNDGKHLKMKVKFPAEGEVSPLRGGGEHILEAIAFGQGFLVNTISVGNKIDAVFELSANEWNGNKTMQLRILDVKIL